MTIDLVTLILLFNFMVNLFAIITLEKLLSYVEVQKEKSDYINNEKRYLG